MLRHYLLWTGRTLAADPWTSLLNLLALSLGLVSFALAAATALYMRSSDADLPNAERVYTVTQQIINADGTDWGGPGAATSGPTARYMAADYPETEAITQLVFTQPYQIEVKGRPRKLDAVFFDKSFGKVFKLPLRFGDADQAFSQPNSAVLLAEAAESLFGAVNPIGQTLRIGGIDLTVTGVLAPRPAPSIFRRAWGNDIDMLISHDIYERIETEKAEPEAWGELVGSTYVLLPPGKSPDELKTKLASFGQRHVHYLNRHYKFGLVPMTRAPETNFNGLIRTDQTGLSFPAVLIALGGLVLLVASLNYANLAAAKAVGRLPESGMKKVLGATRRDLLAQYLTESLVLTIAALALVLLLLAAVAGPFEQITSIDLHRFLFHRYAFWAWLLAGVSLATLAGGFYPAWLLSGPKAIAATLGGKVRQARSRLASVLVALQFFSAAFLLIMVWIVLLQNDAMRRMAFPPEGGKAGMLTIDTPLDAVGLGVSDIRNALRDIPGVQAVAGSSSAPWWGAGLLIVRMFPDEEGKKPAIRGYDFQVTEDYFSALRIPLLAGRGFSAERGGDFRPEDLFPKTPFNIVIDRDIATSFGWTPEQAVGQTVFHSFTGGGTGPMQIIGVVENRPQFLAADAAGNFYSMMQKDSPVALVRLAPDAGPDTLAGIDRALAQLSPQVEWHREFADTLFEKAVMMFDTVLAVLGTLSLFTVVIALLGLAGMAVHIVNSRTEEIGIRKILGADHLVIMRLLLWDMTKPVLIASIAAWPIGYIAGQLYLSQFAGHPHLGPWPFLISLAVIMGVAWLAVGWRVALASAKSPADILRHE